MSQPSTRTGPTIARTTVYADALARLVTMAPAFVNNIVAEADVRAD